MILRPSYNDTWPSDVLKGVLDILQNRVGELWKVFILFKNNSKQ